MSNIQIHLDEDNELRFGVAVEGAESGNITCRLVLESPNSSMGIMFPGHSVTNGEVRVLVPSLKSFLNEGIYPMKLEVLVDDRVFTPLSMNVELKQSVKVTAEARVIHKKKGTSVSATVLNEASRSEPRKPTNPVGRSAEKKKTKATPNKPVRKINKNIERQRLVKEQRKARAPSPAHSAPEKDLKNMLVQLFNKGDI
jgi:hypothetical protein